MFGELIPIGGGDAIPLLKVKLVLGRREDCDIVLRFGNVSGKHCELTLDRGWWFVKDGSSQNGTRVNGLRVARKRLDPGDRLTIARNDYEVRYSPAANGGDETTPPEDDVFSDIMGKSLLESAGLDRRQFERRGGAAGRRRPAATPPSGNESAAADADSHLPGESRADGAANPNTRKATDAVPTDPSLDKPGPKNSGAS